MSSPTPTDDWQECIRCLNTYIVYRVVPRPTGESDYDSIADYLYRNTDAYVPGTEEFVVDEKYGTVTYTVNYCEFESNLRPENFLEQCLGPNCSGLLEDPEDPLCSSCSTIHGSVTDEMKYHRVSLVKEALSSKAWQMAPATMTIEYYSPEDDEYLTVVLEKI
jgi:hypothetical protein